MAQELGFGEDDIQDIDVGKESVPFHDEVEGMERATKEMEDTLGISIKMSDVDIVDFVKTFQKIVTKANAKKSIALVNGDPTVPLNKVLWDRLHPDEAFSMAVRWCAFFVTAVDTQSKTKSDQPSELHTQAKVV